jgi:hypothetical protein
VAVKFLNSDIPFVYSGVNKEHADHGFDQAKNTTGVLLGAEVLPRFVWEQ